MHFSTRSPMSNFRLERGYRGIGGGVSHAGKVAAGAVGTYMNASYVESVPWRDPLNPLARPKQPDAATPRRLAVADPNPQHAMLSAANSEVINLRVNPDLIDQLDAAAASEHATRKMVIARVLAAASYRVQPADLGDHTPKTRRSRRAMA